MNLIITNYQSALAAYHSLQFDNAISLLVEGGDPQSCELRVKCYLEKAKGEKAVELCDDALANQIEGSFNYWRGVALYIQGANRNDVLDSFYAASHNKETLAPLGQAFIHYSFRDMDEALKCIVDIKFEDSEADHIRRLIVVQALLDSGRSSEAIKVLAESYVFLRDNPSLLRTYWAEVMEIRIFRSEKRFELAKVFLDRLFTKVGKRMAPRLYRNLVEAEELIGKISETQFIKMPSKNLEETINKIAANSGLTSKPILNALFDHLYRSGGEGTCREDIVRAVWNQEYSAAKHNERFYKAIKRLRAKIGDDEKAPRYLTRRGEKYVLQMS
jgi:tetratricopeptide (TPR) repeat protein